MSHVKNRSLLHFVWTTYKRTPWIKPEIAQEVHRYIQAVAQNNGCDVLAVGGMPDHIHLLICMSTTVTIAQMIQQVKGSSSHVIQHKLLPGTFFKWQAGYAIFGVSPSHKARLVTYIQNQEKHHTEGSIWPGAEPDNEDPDEE